MEHSMHIYTHSSPPKKQNSENRKPIRKIRLPIANTDPTPAKFFENCDQRRNTINTPCSFLGDLGKSNSFHKGHAGHSTPLSSSQSQEPWQAPPVRIPVPSPNKDNTTHSNTKDVTSPPRGPASRTATTGAFFGWRWLRGASPIAR